MVGRRRRAAGTAPALAAWQVLAEAQDGVVSRRQLLGLGLAESAIAALRDSGRWACALPGVYLTFTGPVPATARAWAAVLYASTTTDARDATDGARTLGPMTGAGLGRAALGQAALSGTTALWLYGVLDAPPEVTTVVVPHGRKVRPQPGVVVLRCRDLCEVVHPAALPPRVRLERALLDVTAEQTRPERVVDLVLRATQRRLTTPSRLLAEPAHGRRARRFRDARYRRWGVVVELDGREAHPDDERFRDRTRDNEVAVDGDVALRYGMREVAGDACGCAAQLVTVLRARGWRGTPRPCGPGCPVL